MKRIILTLIFILIFTVFVTADIYIKRVKETEPFEMMGKKRPGQTEIEEIWMTRNVFVSDGKALKVMIDYEKKRIMFIVKPEKKAVEIPLTFTRETLGKHFPPKVVEILKSVKLSHVKATVDKKRVKIGNWNCFKTVMEMNIEIPALGMMPRMKITTWLSGDAPFNYNEYKKGMSDFFEGFFKNFITLPEEIKAEFEKLDGIKGFEVGADVEFNFFGTTINSNMRVIEVKKMNPPAGMYSIPAGFQKVDLFTVLGLAGKR